MKRKHRRHSNPPSAGAPKPSSQPASPLGAAASFQPAAKADKGAVREEMEPTSKLAPTPLWLIFLFGLLFYLGMLYVDHAGGGFNEQVYEPFPDLAALKNSQPPSEGGDLIRKGEKVYGIYCV